MFYTFSSSFLYLQEQKVANIVRNYLGHHGMLNDMRELTLGRNLMAVISVGESSVIYNTLRCTG